MRSMAHVGGIDSAPSMESGLGSIEDISDQKVKIEHYKQRLTDIFSEKNENEITAFVDHSKLQDSQEDCSVGRVCSHMQPPL